jgi:hypothetical protein
MVFHFTLVIENHAKVCVKPLNFDPGDLPSIPTKLPLDYHNSSPIVDLFDTNEILVSATVEPKAWSQEDELELEP